MDFRQRHVATRSENPRHEHEYHCIGFILDGLGRAEFAREAWKVQPGDLNIIPAGVAHRERFGTPRVGWSSVELLNASDEIDPLARRAFARPVQISRGPATEIARRISVELEGADDLSPLVLWGLGIELMATIARSEDFDSPRTIPRWLPRVLELLRVRCCEALAVSEIAREAGVHPGHLARVFFGALGCTIGQYLRAERVERAKTLLARGDQSIAMIAAQVGFSDQAHLTRAFKRVTGVTPGAYRVALRSR